MKNRSTFKEQLEVLNLYDKASLDEVIQSLTDDEVKEIEQIIYDHPDVLTNR